MVDPGFFNRYDRPDTQQVAIISQALEARFFPATDAAGNYLRMGSAQDLVIVSVASDAKIRSLGEEPRPFIYRAYAQEYDEGLTIVARTARDPEALGIELLTAAKTYDPDFGSLRLTTMQRHIATSALPAQLQALLLSAFVVIALALATIGLYGIVNYAVSQRTREVGIRLSLGTDGGSVVRMLMSTGLRAVLVGCGTGMLVAVLLNRLVAGLLFGVSSLDLWAFPGTTVVLTATAVAATWLPARRVSRISPMTALRFE